MTSTGEAARSRRSDHRRRVQALVRPHRWRVAALAAASYVGGTSEAVFLLLAARLALAVTRDEPRLALWGAASIGIGGAIALAAGLLLLRLVANAAVVTLSTGLAQAVLTTTRGRLSAAYLNASWSLQQNEPSGSLQTLSSYADGAVRVVNAFSASITAGLSLLSLLVVATSVDPLATLVIVTTLGLLGRLMTPLRTRIRRRSTSDTRANTTFNETLSELSTLGLEMQTFGVRDRFARRIDALSGRHAAAARRTSAMQGMLTPVYTTLAYGGVLGGLAVFAATGAGKISAIGPVMLLLLRSLAYGQQLQTSAGSLMAFLPPLERVQDAIARYDAARASDGDTVVERIGAIEAREVSYAYPDGRTVLADVSFRLRAGEVVGIIGPSGSGKSTLVQLLLGLREPSTGEITVDGIALQDVNRGAWSTRVAFVAQEPRLITGTVADNIRFFRDDIGDEALVRAANLANLQADIARMPDGFASFLGERGTNLSGGQRQRLSIARALAGSPQALFLDEPTSALDAHSEALIRSTLHDLRGKVLTVVIAHRMSTLEVCDRILVVESGRLTAIGTPADVAASSAFYRHALDVAHG